MTLNISGDAGARYLVVAADTPGSTTVPSGACAGTELGIEAAVGMPRRFGPLSDTDGDGAIIVRPSVPDSLCGQVLQLIDLGSCAMSDVRVLGAADLLGADPLATTPAPWPRRSHGLAPSDLLDLEGPPYPTSTWWQNLVLGDGTLAVNAWPYILRAYPDGLSTGSPNKVAADTFVFTYQNDDLRLQATEPLTSRAVIAADDLSVTMAWEADEGRMTAPIVRGMPYVTTQYEDLTPQLTTTHALLTLDGGAPTTPATGTQFEITLNNGQTWRLYASSSLTLSGDGGGLSADAPFTGTLRAALVQPGTEAILDAHAGRIPWGGTVSATAEADVAEMVFTWDATGPGELLTMALPHHLPVLSGPTETALVHNTIKGDMQGQVGDRWVLTEPLTTIDWTAPRPIDPAREADIREALAEDVGFTVLATDTYFAGKQLAALGRLALIADELGEVDTAEDYRAELRTHMEAWLSGTNADPLVYDETWGGVVASSGITDPGAAFGQGYYNDHHFHYGYHVYAAAVLAKDDPAWAETWGDAVRHLIRDYAEPSGLDPDYTAVRHKDWFLGHSWANGLFSFVDSKNQESTSEAVNAYYAVYLWGLATDDTRLRDVGRLLLATELRSSWLYWQIMSSDGIYPEPFASNKVVGVLWSTKVEYVTWFGAAPEYIHGIQYLPFTPISEELLRSEWLAESYPVVAETLTRPDLAEGWRGFIYMAHGVLDPDAAWDEAATLTGYDDGNTRTNTLYWLATRP